MRTIKIAALLISSLILATYFIAVERGLPLRFAGVQLLAPGRIAANVGTSPSNSKYDGKEWGTHVPTLATYSDWVPIGTTTPRGGGYQLIQESVAYVVGTTHQFIDADPQSFVYSRAAQDIGKDSVSIYYIGQREHEIDSNSLKVLSTSQGFWSGYAVDRLHVYYFWYSLGPSDVPGADPTTFTLVDPPPGCGNSCAVTFDARDAHHYFSSGEIVSPPPTTQCQC